MARQHQEYKQSLPEGNRNQFSIRVYQQAEQQALWYFNLIAERQRDSRIFGELRADIDHWSLKHKQSAHKNQWQSLTDMDSWSFLEKLAAEGELKSYLLKTIRYIFLRDLGMRLDEPKTEQLVSDTATKVLSLLRKHSKQHKQQSFTDTNGLMFRWAKKRGLETTYEWLLLKLAQVEPLFTNDKGQTHGMRKLVKIIAGVVLHHLILESHDEQNLDTEQLDTVIRLGYCYGLTYPFIDDLQDSAVDLNPHDKALFNQALRTSLQTGQVVAYPAFEDDNSRLRQIYRELKWAFEFIKSNLDSKQAASFFERAYVFFEAQDIDRQRSLATEADLPLAEIYLPVMLKSAGCRLIARDLVATDTDQAFDYRTFCFGIYNQFNDDIKDIFEDIDEDNLTPYSHYLVHAGNQAKRDNPYRYYWAVVHYLINDVYAAEPVTRTLLIERCINAHKSLLQAIGEVRYKKLEQSLLSTGDAAFDRLIHDLVFRPADIAWFDKLISQEVAREFTERKQRSDHFKRVYEAKYQMVSEHLHLTPNPRIKDGHLSKAANYALTSGGKRLRPVIAMYLGEQFYDFSAEQCREVSQLLEYMHTASLILDDLPSQDDADFRRGSATVHKKYNSTATAELSAVYLMMKAVEIQSRIKTHQPERVLASLAYAAETTQAICEGQMLDLKSHQRPQSEADLIRICHLKTGLALEASMVIPALLAGKDEIHIGQLKQLARHIGLMFQIKDDLLDEYGSEELLGKPVAQDEQHDRATFVTLYGVEGATSTMFENYHQARAIVSDLPKHSDFMLTLLDYIIYRNH